MNAEQFVNDTWCAASSRNRAMASASRNETPARSITRCPGLRPLFPSVSVQTRRSSSTQGPVTRPSSRRQVAPLSFCAGPCEILSMSVPAFRATDMPGEIRFSLLMYVTVFEGVTAIDRGSNRCRGPYEMSWLRRRLVAPRATTFRSGSFRRCRDAEFLHSAPQGIGVHPQNRRGTARAFDHSSRAFQHVENVQALDILE